MERNSRRSLTQPRPEDEDQQELVYFKPTPAKDVSILDRISGWFAPKVESKNRSSSQYSPS